MDPAAIRFNNPGAMWGKGNRIATKWGATSTTVLNDGLGQGNNIAYFPTKLQGACAQFDLWRQGYCNMTLAAAIRKWSGGNWSQPYANFLTQQTGLGMDTQVTTALLASPSGWKLMKAQAQWEAGRPYPLDDNSWIRAQATVFTSKPVTATQKKTAAATTVVVATGAATAQAASNGHSGLVIFGILIVGALVTAGVWFWIHRKHEATVTAVRPPPQTLPDIRNPASQPPSGAS